MCEFPFQLTVKPASADSLPQTVMCTGLLRTLSGKRKVFDAVWDQKPVIVKVFTDPIKAKYHMKREWRGLKLLQERRLNSPAPLFFGKAKGYGWVVVTQKITDAPNVREIWDNTTDPGQRCELLCRVSRELAIQHSKGVLQKDLHLGNFLIQKETLFTLDPSEMRFLPGKVSKKEAIDQLALLASNTLYEDTDTVASVREEYSRTRSWKFDGSGTALFFKRLVRHQQDGIRNGLEKCLRTSRKYQRIKGRGYCGAAARDFFERTNFRDFVENIDTLMQNGKVLKNGNTCFVSRINLAGKDVVVKRYNHKGIIHSVRHTIRRSRARRCWLHAHRLEMLNIATPKPLAYIESLRGILVWSSYFISEYVEGRKLCDFLRGNSAGQDLRSKVSQQLRELLDNLGKHHITHGDLKHTNILLTGNGPVLTDLDGMKVHRLGCMCRRRHQKDLERFMNRGLSRYASV
ncbi:MAG TPA: lipopolysaccharide kinase InaA family protein [Sedimentisphaerales bacterium]|nr:lipopolysaccharide kinase InaA family protein [Sedimentisphaerales bacterium]